MIRAKILKVDTFTSKKGNEVATVFLIAENFELPFKLFVYRNVDKIPPAGSEVSLGVGVDSQFNGVLELKL